MPSVKGELRKYALHTPQKIIENTAHAKIIMKPRILYAAVFTFLSLSGGRFTATFMEHELKFSQNWMIGGAMALQVLSSSLLSSWFGSVADSWEAGISSSITRNNPGVVSSGDASTSTNMFIRWNSWNRGRLLMMTLGLLLSTISILLHSFGTFWMSQSQSLQQISISVPVLTYHLFLRAMFAAGVAACVPVLDGLTLAQLEKEGRDSADYGKERVYGK